MSRKVPSEATAEGGRPSLVVSTQLVELARTAYWQLGLYPGAAEANGSFQPALARERHYVPRGKGHDAGRCLEEAARRAGGRLRRYCAHNRLNRLGTLTYDGTGCLDQLELRHDVGLFMRRLRQELGRSFPYAWVPEWHPGGHGLHAHFALGRYVKWSLINDLWGLGRVDIRLLRQRRMGSGALEESRQAGRYLAKYVSKGMAEGREFGLHRYDVAEGFQPTVELIKGRTAADVVAEASERMGSAPLRLWRSRGERRWFGPPALWVAWGGA